MKTLCFLALASTLSFNLSAQTDKDDDAMEAPAKKHHKGHSFGVSTEGSQAPTPSNKWYMSNSFDGAMFSTAYFSRPGAKSDLTFVRFSMLNFGYNFNYDFDNHFGIFTGIGIKNLGFIEKDGDSTIKRRVYTVGVPLGFKLGNLQKKHYGFVGGGIDVPFNYREKGFLSRSHKQKFSEWFSKRNADYMPYVFVGMCYGKGSTLKIQYYPSNFFNPDFTETKNGVTSRPYAGYDAKLLYVTIGFDINYKKNKKAETSGAAAPAEDDN
ncbi:MAG: hypothetical protein ABI169_04045 [Chitinophagaceae bacterium]